MWINDDAAGIGRRSHSLLSSLLNVDTAQQSLTPLHLNSTGKTLLYFTAFGTHIIKTSRLFEFSKLLIRIIDPDAQVPTEIFEDFVLGLTELVSFLDLEFECGFEGLETRHFIFLAQKLFWKGRIPRKKRE